MLFVKHAVFWVLPSCAGSELPTCILLTQLNEGVFPNVESIFHFSYQICEFKYERELHYDKIIGCYLRDPVRKVSKSGASGLSASQ